MQELTLLEIISLVVEALVLSAWVGTAQVLFSLHLLVEELLDNDALNNKSKESMLKMIEGHQGLPISEEEIQNLLIQMTSFEIFRKSITLS